jgi:hypothetical protein
VRKPDPVIPSIDDPKATSARIILFAQSLSVIASISGLIGLIIAYKALVRKEPDSRNGTIQPPTIE